MIRYLRLYAYFLRFSFSKAMEFRMDFFFRVIMDVIFYAVQFAFFNIIYLHTPILAGWEIEQMRIFIVSFIFIDALFMTVFSTNAWWLPIYINRGDLDYYLTKPVSTLFFLSFKEFAANSFLNLLIAFGLVWWAIDIYPSEFSAIKILIYFFMLSLGTTLYCILNILFLLAVFWTQAPRGFGDLFFSVSHIMERPERIYRGIARKVFVYILPFGIMASYPAQYLVEKNQDALVWSMGLITLCFFIILQVVWRLGLKNYSSASS